MAERRLGSGSAMLGLVAFVASRDLEVAGRLYGEVFGFRRLEASTFSNAHDAKDTQLRVTVVDRVVQARYTVLGWRVLDIVDDEPDAS